MLIFLTKLRLGMLINVMLIKKNVAIEIMQEFQSNLEEEVNSSII